MSNMSLNIVKDFSINCLDANVSYSFMNLASLSSFFTKTDNDNISYFCDGMLMVLAVKLITKEKIKRVSFDYTSIAGDVFDYAAKHKKPVYIVGAEQYELDNFVNKIQSRHSGLIVAGSRNGYFDEAEQQSIYRSVIDSGAEIVVAGLGAGKQELFLSGLHHAGYQGVSFSCGGFIRQESSTELTYYPKWINALSLRAFYRMYKEPHTIRRYLIDYPRNTLVLFNRSIFGKLSTKVVDYEQV